MRLYKMEITSIPSECDHPSYRPVAGSPGYVERRRDWKPEGWVEFVAEEIERGRKWSPDESFFWPSEDKLYRSRSSAAEKVAIVERWGGTARILEADVSPFIPVAEANERRKRRRDAVRIARLQAKIDSIRGTSDGIPF